MRIIFVCVIGFCGWWLITDSYQKKQESLAFESAENAMVYSRDLLQEKGRIKRTINGLSAGSTPLKNSTEIVNKVNDITGFGCTIFSGDIRISTTASVEGSDEAAVGTRSNKMVSDKVYGLGETFKGITETIGKDWLIIYEPLRDENGQLVGMIAVFKEYQEFLSDLYDFKLLVAVTILVFMFLVLVLIWSSQKRKNKLLLEQEKTEIKNRQLKVQKDELENLIFVVEEIEQTIAIIDNTDKIIWVNRSFEKDMQYTNREIIGQKASDILGGPETDRLVIKKMDEAIFVWKQPIDCTVLQYRKDGTYYWAQVYLTPFLDEHGEVDKYVAISLDISKEKMARELLEESEGNIRKIGETIDDAVYLYNIEYKRFEYMSPKCNAVLGVNQNFFYAGQNYENLFVLDKYKGLIKNAKKDLINGKSFDIEYEIDFENSTRWIRERSHPIYNDNGKVVKNSGVFSDITESKNLQAELTRKTRDFKLLTEIGMDLTQGLSINRIIETVHSRIGDIMDGNCFAIGIIDKANNRIHFPKIIDNDTVFPDVYYSLDEHVLAVICVTEKEEIVMNDVRNDIRQYTKKELMQTVGGDAMSLIYLRLLFQGEVIGVITVQSLNKYAYQKEHVEFLRTLSVYISNALANAILYDSNQALIAGTKTN